MRLYEQEAVLRAGGVLRYVYPGVPNRFIPAMYFIYHLKFPTLYLGEPEYSLFCCDVHYKYEETYRKMRWWGPDFYRFYMSLPLAAATAERWETWDKSMCLEDRDHWLSLVIK